MKNKNDNFFIKYNLKPNKTKEELNVYFQTSPKYRRYLPSVVRLINDYKKLLEEEIKYYELKKESPKVYFYEDKISKKELEKIKSKRETSNLKNLELLKLKEEELKKINKIFEKDIDLLHKKISFLIENELFYKEDIKLYQESIAFLKKLPKQVFKDAYVYKTYEHFVSSKYEKITDRVFLNATFIDVLSLLNQKELEKKLELLLYISIMMIEEKFSEFSSFKEQGEILLQNYSYFNYRTKFKFDEDKAFKIVQSYMKFVIHISNLSSENYKLYYNSFNMLNKQSTAETLFQFAQVLRTMEFPYETVTLFQFFIEEKLNLQNEMVEIHNIHQKTNNLVKNFDEKLNIVTHHDLQHLIKKQIIISPAVIDKFLAKLSFFHLFNDEDFDKRLFDGILNIAYDGLALLNLSTTRGMQEINYLGKYSGTQKYTYGQEYIIDFLSLCPSDWEFENKTIRAYLYYQLSYRKSDYESEYLKYNEKYLNLDANYTYSKFAEKELAKREELIYDISYHYDKAVNNYKKEKYEQALSIFKKIFFYKDAASIIQRIENIKIDLFVEDLEIQIEDKKFIQLDKIYSNSIYKDTKQVQKVIKRAQKLLREYIMEIIEKEDYKELEELLSLEFLSAKDKKELTIKYKAQVNEEENKEKYKELKKFLSLKSKTLFDFNIMISNIDFLMDSDFKDIQEIKAQNLETIEKEKVKRLNFIIDEIEKTKTKFIDYQVPKSIIENKDKKIKKSKLKTEKLKLLETYEEKLELFEELNLSNSEQSEESQYKFTAAYDLAQEKIKAVSGGALVSFFQTLFILILLNIFIYLLFLVA